MKKIDLKKIERNIENLCLHYFIDKFPLSEVSLDSFINDLIYLVLAERVDVVREIDKNLEKTGDIGDWKYIRYIDISKWEELKKNL